jgi:poly-gamma-glutamate system protein
MRKVSSNIKLLIVFLIAFTGAILSAVLNKHETGLPYREEMKEASNLAQQWFDIIKEVKDKKQIVSDAHSNVPNSALIGDDWSEITTTLGSLEAKETSTNPDFAALVVRWLHEATIKQGDKVGVVLSGSFPSISISVMAALQTMKIDAVVTSSLGASTFGANQEAATWIDMEHWLELYGGLSFHSELVSMGAGQDNGNGLTENGKSLLRLAAERNHIELYEPANIIESIEKKKTIFIDNEISLLINIGGNMTSLGACSHSLSIPNGLNYTMTACQDEDRGVIVSLNELGIPFIQFLNIKELAGKYGIEISPGNHYEESTNLYTTSESNKLITILLLIFSAIPVYFLRKKVK